MNPNDAGSEMMKNPQFMELFQRVLGDGKIPDEKDPNRDKWLKDMQDKLAAEATKEAKKKMETPVSDKDGQWMYVIPEKGFCVKCGFEGGLKGKLFINICQHERIAEPIPMPDEEQEEGDAIKFKIPLSCGQTRIDKDKSGVDCKVVDVIVNTNTIKKCNEDAEFRRFVAALCMTWIKQKSEPKLNADEFKNVNFACKGVLEAQRIRLSSTPKDANALNDEIKLPGAKTTAPLQAGKGGKLVQEIGDQPAAPLKASFELTVDGEYDWSAHQRPARNPHFREAVPRSITVSAIVPNVQTIKEVDVQISAKTVLLTYVDTETPFLTITLPYPVNDEPEAAKFIKSKSLLKLTLVVTLPDETDESVKTKASRNVEEEEAEQRALDDVERDKKYKDHMAKQKRLQDSEKDVMDQRKEYVANMNAVIEGSIPPTLRDEIDAMPVDQQRAMMVRLEGKILKGDSVDEMLQKMPAEMIDTICNHIRSKLGLEPMEKPQKKEKPKVTFEDDKKGANQWPEKKGDGAAKKSDVEALDTSKGPSKWEKQMEDQTDPGATVEYNFAKKPNSCLVFS